MKAAGVAGIASAFSGVAGGESSNAGRLANVRGPLRSSRFTVELELEGGSVSGWKEIQLPEVSTEEVSYREGNERKSSSRKLWGRTEYDDLTMERGVQPGDLRLWDWRKQVMEGRVDEARKDIAVNILGTAGEQAARFEFTAAWPIKYSPPTLDATATNGEGALASEEIEIAYEKYERTA